MNHIWKDEAVNIILAMKSNTKSPLTKIYKVLIDKNLYDKNYSSFTRDFKLYFCKESINGEFVWTFKGIRTTYISTDTINNQLQISESILSAGETSEIKTEDDNLLSNQNNKIIPFEKKIETGKEKIIEILDSKNIPNEIEKNTESKETISNDVNEGIKSIYYRLSNIESRLERLEKSIFSIVDSKNKEKEIFETIITILYSELIDKKV